MDAKTRHKRWRDANKDHLRAEAKRWRKKLHFYYLEYSRQYYRKNREALKVARHLGVSLTEARKLLCKTPTASANSQTV